MATPSWLHGLDTEGIIHSAAALSLANLQHQLESKRAADQLKLGYDQLAEQARQHNASIGVQVAGLNQRGAGQALQSQDRNRSNDRIANVAANNLGLGYDKLAAASAAAALRDAQAKARQESIDRRFMETLGYKQGTHSDLQSQRQLLNNLRERTLNLRSQGFDETTAHNIAMEEMAKAKIAQTKQTSPKLSLSDAGLIKDRTAQINALEKEKAFLRLHSNPVRWNEVVDAIGKLQDLNRATLAKPEYQAALPQTTPITAASFLAPQTGTNTAPFETGDFTGTAFDPNNIPQLGTPPDDQSGAAVPAAAALAPQYDPFSSGDYTGTPLENAPMPQGTRVQDLLTGQAGWWTGNDPIPDSYQILDTEEAQP